MGSYLKALLVFCHILSDAFPLGFMLGWHLIPGTATLHREELLAIHQGLVTGWELLEDLPHSSPCLSSQGDPPGERQWVFPT